VAERRERTAEEREAARLERERKRAARMGKAAGKNLTREERAPRRPARQPAPVVREPEPASVASPAARAAVTQRQAEPLAPEPVAPAAQEPEPLASEPEAVEPPEPAPEAVAASEPLVPALPAPGADHDGDGAVAGAFQTDEHEPAPGLDHHPEDGAGETGEHELELPSGTRRVSARQKPPSPPRKPPKRRPKRPPDQPGRRRLWIGRAVAVVALGVAGVLIWFLIELFQPLVGSPHGHVTVTIPPRSSSDEIATTLQRDGVISSGFFFKLRATLAGERDKMRAGVYHLQLGMGYGSVLTALTKAPPAAKVTELTITEGRRRQQINQLLRQQHVRGSYLAATRSTKLLNLRAYGLRHKPRSLEGFLFPDTYQLTEPIRISKLVADQLKTFKGQFAKVNLGYARRKHLTPYDVLIIASLIEAETPTVHDRPLVSSVIYNRLANGMALQLDSTTQYATGNFTRPLTVSQLHSHSPYNTRTHVGLPPTPIGNPGMASIQAAAHPAQTKYLFFFAKPCARGSVFANNYAQFLGQNRRYQSKHC
jgi:uncharacterized YceG family protein